MTEDNREKLLKVKEQLEKKPKGIAVGVFDEQAFIKTMDGLVEKLSTVLEAQSKETDEKQTAVIEEVRELASDISASLASGMTVKNLKDIEKTEKVVVSNLKDLSFPEKIEVSNFDVSKLATNEVMGEIKQALNRVAESLTETDQAPESYVPYRRVVKKGNRLTWDDSTGGGGGGISVASSESGGGGGGDASAANQVTGNTSLATIAANTDWASADYFPMYNRSDLGAAVPNVDPFGSLQTRGPVLTDEGMGRINFTGNSLTRSIGDAVFEQGSQVVIGEGFVDTYDLHQGAAVRLDADTDADWNIIIQIIDDNVIVLASPYTGTGGAGAASTSVLPYLVGSGGSLAVANGKLTVTTGSTAESETMLFSPVFNGGGYIQAAVSLSHRRANQDIYFGYERSPFAIVTEFARFKFTGTTNNVVVAESGYNPTTAPSASEIESTSVTIPDGDITTSILNYKIEFQPDKVTFSINGNIVATHTKRFPHFFKSYPLGNWVSIRTVNGATPPAGSTDYVVDYIFGKVFNRLDVQQASPGDNSNSQVVSLRDANTSFDTLQAAATATGNGVALFTDGMATVIFTVTISATATVTFEGTEDGTNWFALNTNRQGTDTIGSTAVNSAQNGAYKADVSGFTYVRSRISSYGSGTVTVTAHATPMISASRVVNANITASQTLGTVTTLTNGGIAHDAADSGNPHKIGTKSVATLNSQTLVAANDRSNAFSDLDGSIQVRYDGTIGDYVSGTASNTDGSSTQVLAAGAAGIKHHITDVTVSNSSAAAVLVELKDGSTTKWQAVVPLGGSVNAHFHTPLLGSAATAWNFDPATGTTTVYCTVQGFKSKI